MGVFRWHKNTHLTFIICDVSSLLRSIAAFVGRPLVLEVDQGTLTCSIQALEHALRIPLFEQLRTGALLMAEGAMGIRMDGVSSGPSWMNAAR